MPLYAIKDICEIRGKAPVIINLEARWERVVSVTLCPLYLRKRNPISNKRRQ
jgi:hypothetical protein